jgi:hypothetical protein
MNRFRGNGAGRIIDFGGMDFACKIMGSRRNSPQLFDQLGLMSVPMLATPVRGFARPEDMIGYLNNPLSHPGNGLFMGVRGTPQSRFIRTPPSCQSIVTLAML